MGNRFEGGYCLGEWRVIEGVVIIIWVGDVGVWIRMLEVERRVWFESWILDGIRRRSG